MLLYPKMLLAKLQAQQKWCIWHCFWLPIYDDEVLRFGVQSTLKYAELPVIFLESFISIIIYLQSYRIHSSDITLKMAIFADTQYTILPTNCKASHFVAHLSTFLLIIQWSPTISTYKWPDLLWIHLLRDFLHCRQHLGPILRQCQLATQLQWRLAMSEVYKVLMLTKRPGFWWKRHLEFVCIFLRLLFSFILFFAHIYYHATKTGRRW